MIISLVAQQWSAASFGEQTETQAGEKGARSGTHALYLSGCLVARPPAFRSPGWLLCIIILLRHVRSAEFSTGAGRARTQASLQIAPVRAGQRTRDWLVALAG